MYLFGYQIKFKNVEEQAVIINIYDTNSGEGTTVFTQLVGAADPCHILITDNNEDKFTPIKAKQAEIKFKSTRETNSSTFIATEDDRWYVEISVGGNIKFKGYLLCDDMDEDFLDPDTENDVSLKATDNIGLLKDVPLTDFEDKNPRGTYSLIQFVAWCFSKTNLSLPINLCHNLQEVHSSLPMYQSCYNHSKTWEREINESINCYQVLESILGNDSFATQSGGEWWICRVDEFRDSAGQNNRYDYEGKFIEAVSFDTTLSVDPDAEVIYFAEKATFVAAQQPVKKTALTYNYNFPKEIVDNIDFERGTEYFTQEFTEDSIAKVRKRYRIEDWLFRKNTGLDQVGGEGEAYIERVFVNGYEKSRVLVIKRNTGGQLWLISNPIPVGKSDKFTFSVDVSLNQDLGGSNFYRTNTAQVRLYGEDGTYWTLHGSTSLTNDNILYWMPTGPTFTIDQRYFVVEGMLNEDQTDWKTILTGECEPLPVAGDVYIALLNAQTLASETRFQNLRFDYIPYINGSYAKYRGQQHTVSQDKKTKKVYEESVQVSDSPRPLFKGSLFYVDSTSIVATSATFGLIGPQNVIIIPGVDRRSLFGEYVKVSGTTNNNRIFRITNRFYNNVDSITTLFVQEAAVTETVSATFSSAKFKLAEQFIDGLNPGDEKPFGFHQVWGVWNQYNRPFILFDFQLQGLNGASTFPDIIHKWEVAEDTKYSNNKLFMMLHYDQDLKLCEWKGVMMEFLDTTIDKDYDSTYSFKYITE